MPTYQTLAHTPLSDLLEVFNGAFSDYLVPFFLTAEQLQGRITSEGLRLDLSVGAFEQGRLVGFVLHGEDQTGTHRLAYNGGTGVLPAHRGQGITAAMYAHIIPVLRAQGIDKVLLEVITANAPALKTYERIGFVKERALDCFKGTLRIESEPTTTALRRMDSYPWQEIQTFWDFQPSWQNNIRAVENLGNAPVGIGYYEADTLLGYVIFNSISRRIQQLAVHPAYRRRGIGRQLLHALASLHGSELTLINVDSRSEAASRFLTRMGLERYIGQYEMGLTLAGS